MTRPVIGYCGMTHLGINSAAGAAQRGFDTLCFDPDPALIARLAKGELPVTEPDLDRLWAENAPRLSFSADLADLARCDVVYVAPDVPTDDRGGSDLSGLSVLLDRVEPALRADAVLVVLSQVPPGFTRARGRARGPLHYQVETLIFGRAVERAVHPERFIVGCSDPAQPLPPALAAYLGGFGCPILPMRLESAELCKIAINMCLVAQVSVANTMAELCEHLGADWAEVVPALKLDKRIGAFAYLAPGLGIAGGNLERDLATVCRMAETKGTDSRVVQAWIANSGHRRHWPLRVIHQEVLARRRAPVIAVLGLAYKQDTHSTKNSPSLAFINALGPDVTIRAYDPVVPASAAGHAGVVQTDSALEACRGADALVLMTPWGQFRDLAAADIAAALAGRVVLDPYAVLDRAACVAAGLAYHTLGVPALGSEEIA